MAMGFVNQEPLKKLFEKKDWRYSGIHALAISGTKYFYTGSGDKSVKAWSLRDYSLSCTMNGHKSTVSTLAICNGVLYSGGWDGTIQLWSLSDHSPLVVLGEDAPGNVIFILSLAAYGDALVVGHEDGSVKIWRNSVLLKSDTSHKGAILSVTMEGTLIFTRGWDKVVKLQELATDKFQVDAVPLGSITSDSVKTALLYQQGKLFVGHADRIIKIGDRFISRKLIQKRYDRALTIGLQDYTKQHQPRYTHLADWDSIAKVFRSSWQMNYLAIITLKLMKKVSTYAFINTNFFSLCCGCFRYAAFGDVTLGNFLAGY